MQSAYDVKLERLHDLMEREGLGALVLSRLDNIFWLTGGGDCHVGLASETAICALVVTPEQVTCVTTNIEAPRLGTEELAGLGIEIVALDWHAADVAAAVARLADGDGRVGADTPNAGRARVDVTPLRYELVPDEVETYRALGADMGVAVAGVAQEFERGETEFQLAGRLSAALLEREITPVVLLVAVDERIAEYRHPIPTTKAVDRAAMLVACGRRKGLIVALTRMVHFGALGDDLSRRHDAVCQVDATFMAHTTPGALVSAIFAAGVKAYEDVGFADEWRLHHQGGATGYAGRDYKATFETNEVVAPWQAFAWNPSIAGTKSEDTMLATPEGPEILSGSPDWPLVEKQAAGRILARPGVLVR